jgi:hypothetical protein
MYTLRIIEETREDESKPFEQVIKNFELGTSYRLARRGCTSMFDQLLLEQPENLQNRIRMFIVGVNGNVFPVLSKTETLQCEYFVMTGNGSTFERL